MGVKGLFSLLANEPSRFGSQWLTDLDSDVHIYIDGPALHHHLIECFQRKSGLPPSIHLSSLDKSSVTVSPCTIYKLTRAFFEQLRLSTSNNSKIHLVCDGVASLHKGKQQIERITENCELFNQAARSFINEASSRTYHVPHLWGEDAMIEAAESDACEKQLVHFAPSEAESFIAEKVATTKERSIVFSNDSDFLVFGVAFVPLHSLEYRATENEKTVIMGWEYTKTQFIAAYPELDEPKNEDSFVVMATMAALSGCDYYLPTHHQRRIASARNIIVNSDIGGLRQKHRNDPTAKFTLLAVLRYIIHFRSQNKVAWMKRMVKAIVSSEGGKDLLVKEQELHQALASIRSSYLGTDIRRLEEGLPANRMVELKRILLQNKFYCKPLMELCEGAPDNERFRNRKSKGKGKSKKKGQKKHVDASDGIMNRTREGASKSYWMSKKFVLCRDNLYAYLALKYPAFVTLKDDASTESVVTEYCRAGGSNNITVQEFQTAIPNSNGGINRFEGRFIYDAIEIFVSEHDEKKKRLSMECVGRLSPSYYYLFYMALLLESRNDLLVLLTISLVPTRMPHNQKKQKEPFDRKEYIKSVGRLQIAALQTKIVFDALTCFGDNDGVEFQQSFSPRFFFCDKILLTSWSIVAELDASEFDEWENNESIMTEIREKVKRAFLTRSYALDDVVDSIWTTWCKLNA